MRFISQYKEYSFWKLFIAFQVNFVGILTSKILVRLKDTLVQHLIDLSVILDIRIIFRIHYCDVVARINRQ